MPNNRTRWIMAGLAYVGLGYLLLPVLGHEVRGTPTATGGHAAAVLGVTPQKTPQPSLISVRDSAARTAALRDTTGDTYDAVGLVQDVVTAWIVDDLPDNHTFGTGDESAGANLISGVDTRIVGTDFGPGVPETNLLQVNYFTVDGSDIVPAGSVSPDDLIYDSWRMDVGTTAAGTDKINWTPNPGFTVVDSGFCVADAGTVLGCFELSLHDSDANGLSGAGVVGLGGEDIAGFGVDELIMYWEIQLAPSCGDGHVDPGEECDDGNTVDGDGCSANCQDESTIPGDFDGDGDVDLADYATFMKFFDGP